MGNFSGQYNQIFQQKETIQENCVRWLFTLNELFPDYVPLVRKRKKWHNEMILILFPAHPSILQIPAIFGTCLDGLNNDKDGYGFFLMAILIIISLLTSD